MEYLQKDEKKVEYIELIYDLIFVYIVGRNSSLFHHIEDGFIKPELFLTYLLSTLIVIQIWSLMSLFINRYGSKSIAEHIGIFINMYLLYYMGEGIRVGWRAYYYQYNAAWALILLDLLILYVIQMKTTCVGRPWEQENIRHFIRLLAVEIVIILISFPVFAFTGYAVSPIAVIAGIAMILVRPENNLVAVDFPHLTERIMLYIVFTFGEMIVMIASYFDGTLSFSSVYFSLMAFLVVVGLFMNYGLLYDHIIDREMSTNGARYMMIHLFLILSLNNITVAMEFMREEEVDFEAKNVFLVGSFLAYYFFLFATAAYSKGRGELCLRNFLPLFAAIGAFVAAMACFYHNAWISVACSVALAFAVYAIMYRYWKKCLLPLEEAEEREAAACLINGED